MRSASLLFMLAALQVSWRSSTCQVAPLNALTPTLHSIAAIHSEKSSWNLHKILLLVIFHSSKNRKVFFMRNLNSSNFYYIQFSTVFPPLVSPSDLLVASSLWYFWIIIILHATCCCFFYFFFFIYLFLLATWSKWLNLIVDHCRCRPIRGCFSQNLIANRLWLTFVVFEFGVFLAFHFVWTFNWIELLSKRADTEICQ